MLIRILALIKRIWVLPDGNPKDPDLILPHGYGLISPIKLPDPSEKTLKAAIKLLKKFNKARVVFSGSSYFWVGSEKNEIANKKSILIKHGIDAPRMIVAEHFDSTIEELKFLKFCIDANKQIKEIVLIGDRYHVRSIRQIANYYISGVDIKYINIDGIWDKSHPSFWQDSEIKWLIVNVMRFIVFFISPRLAINIRHKTKHKE